jgi:menaquinone-dependent protoporphyrinogen IX oxidase
MKDVTRFLENPVEATDIVKKFAFYLLNMCYEKKNKKKKKKKEDKVRRLIHNIFENTSGDFR